MKTTPENTAAILIKALWFLLALALSSCSTEKEDSPRQDDLPVVQPDWTINACNIKYKDRILVLGQNVAEWEKVLGPHDRFVNEIYVFDRFGLKLYERSDVIVTMVLIYKNHPDYSEEYINAIKNDEFMQDSYRRSNQARPKIEYTGVVDVEGGIVKSNMDVGIFNRQRLAKNPEAKEFTEGYLPTLYHLYYHCDPAVSKMDYVGQRIEFQQGSKNLVQQFVMGGELRKK